MEKKDEILDHGQDYDGIKEYDNPLPRWFLLMFYGTILFSFAYMAYYTAKTWSIADASGRGANLAWSEARIAAEMREAESGRANFVPPQGDALLSFVRSPGNISRGEALFKANCVACHGESGQGVVGPNLTDRFWIHGGKPGDVLLSIAQGWPGNGMPAWEASQGPEKVHWLTAYVVSLRGRSVANPKAPQGTEE
jgi:cytochrome c oxidase cbb3-type subunit III